MKALFLVAEGEHAVLKIEVEPGKWVELIRERLDSPFSHTIEDSGIKKAIKDFYEAKKIEDAKKYYECGGCGATNPSQRCIGCGHPFTDEERKQSEMSEIKRELSKD